ncbi:MAG: CHAD domain-containing protein [Nitrososphaeraceae archaeon]
MNENFSHQMADQIDKNFSKVNTILSLYLKNPNVKNIHDIRKSIRRAESAYLILPKKYRKKKQIRYYIDQSKTFFKINSQIRDYDIYLQKIENFNKTYNVKNDARTDNKDKTKKPSFANGDNYSSNNSKIISQIKHYRESKLKKATKAAEKLKDIKCPQIKQDIQKIQTRINRRFKKVTKTFTNEIKKNLPVVINDETKVKELHMLRKDCKMLRYVLELRSNDTKKDSGSKEDDLTKSITELEDLQDFLGEIHDCDEILSFLKKFKNFPETKLIINKESKNRKDLYKKFVDKYQSSIQDLNFITR